MGKNKTNGQMSQSPAERKAALRAFDPVGEAM
jgi:hypothetical protein